ncbi:MAG TPA: pyridoxamine 5'-phosphate oxidase [Actinomycetota bacterium]|jgi:pyridoxamine 5'-phosphate oxidase
MHGLDERDLPADPLQLFHGWFEAAGKSERQPDAMALATATRGGAPSVRMVLLKAADERGLVFATNFDSRKGRELTANPHGAVTLHWVTLHRAVRAEGRVERCTDEESDAIWNARPREARLAAAASEQSRPIPDRDTLERSFAELDARYPGEAVPRPATWGGFRLVPDAWEFWQGREHRLHDRVRYVRDPAGAWTVARLAP